MLIYLGQKLFISKFKQKQHYLFSDMMQMNKNMKPNLYLFTMMIHREKKF